MMKYSVAPSGRFWGWAAFCLLSVFSVFAEPPFVGTIFISPEIIRSSDPSSFQTLEGKGQGVRSMFDRRVNGFIPLNAFLFEARFDDGLRIEVQVNPEFGTAEQARSEALRYMHAVGQLPTALRASVQTMWIHKGNQPFGGGNNNLLIHSEQADAYINDGILEEALLHEAAHTSLDAAHSAAAAWVQAQEADLEFISTYAQENPRREDVAETIVPYIAVRHRADRLIPIIVETINQAIPNRLAYWDAQQLDMYPIVPGVPLALTRARFDSTQNALTIQWNSKAGRVYFIETSTNLNTWQPLAGPITADSASSSHEIARDALGTSSFLRVRQD